MSEFTLNTDAMRIPAGELCDALQVRIARKAARHEELDARRGKGRIAIGSYMENLGWPELFGYAMPRFHAAAAFAIDQHARQAIFWADNVDDDWAPGLRLTADTGMYWTSTLFGQQVRYGDDGVPAFLPHPFAQSGRLRDLGTFDFRRSGDMPAMIERYEHLLALNRERYDGMLDIHFPPLGRGPLDLYVQLRGYEAFVDDIVERPAELREALGFLADTRLQFAEGRRVYLGDEALPSSVSVDDDWVNIPFISPSFFREFMVPVYARIRRQEGPVASFHTCGRLEAIAGDLLRVFPEMTALDVSAWNDLAALDGTVDRRIGFGAAVLNTVSLGNDIEEQRAKLTAIREVGRHRAVWSCAQAIVKLQPTYEETFARLDRFLKLAHAVLAENAG